VLCKARERGGLLGKELWGYVLIWHSKLRRGGYLQPCDGGSGMAAEEERAGGFILEAARVRRRSLAGLLSKYVRWW